MKLNIAFPATGCQKLVDIDDEQKYRIFYEKRMAQDVDVSLLGDEWKGYVFRITGGNDKQGFPMMQGVLTNKRVRLLLKTGSKCYRSKRDGERRRKSVRGCVVDSNISALSCIIVKKGENEIPGLTDTTIPRPLGPKRASKIRKLFNLSKEDDVKQYVVKKVKPPKEGKTRGRVVSPKIQRLITPQRLARKRRLVNIKRKRVEATKQKLAEYSKLLAQRVAERKRKQSSVRERLSTTGSGKGTESKRTRTSTIGSVKEVSSKAAKASNEKALLKTLSRRKAKLELKSRQEKVAFGRSRKLLKA